MVQLTHVERAYTESAQSVGERRLMRPHGGVWLTSGYFITLAAAQKLLAALYPVWTVADHWRNFEAKGLLTLYTLTPNPVWESALSRESHLAPERVRRRKDRKTLTERLLRLWDTAVVRPLFVEKLEKIQGPAHAQHRQWRTLQHQGAHGVLSQAANRSSHDPSNHSSHQPSNHTSHHTSHRPSHHSSHRPEHELQQHAVQKRD